MVQYHGLDLHLRQYIHARNGTTGAATQSISEKTHQARREWLRDEYDWYAPHAKGKARTYFFKEPHTPDSVVNQIFKKDMKQKGHEPKSFRQVYLSQARNAINYLRDNTLQEKQENPFTGQYAFNKEITELLGSVQADHDILGEEYDYDSLEHILAEIHQGIQKHLHRG